MFLLLGKHLRTWTENGDYDGPAGGCRMLALVCSLYTTPHRSSLIMLDSVHIDKAFMTFPSLYRAIGEYHGA